MEALPRLRREVPGEVTGVYDVEPVYFRSGAEFRGWLAEHHAAANEIVLGYFKKGAKETGISYPESVDEALCFGWIDGVRHSVDANRYSIRFTPRRKRSIWSAVNIKRVGELIAEGRMQPAGLKVFEQRDPSRVEQYSFENARPEFEPEQAAAFESRPGAWEFFQAQPPSYRKIATWWVISAKRPETRQRRLGQLIDCSERRQRLPAFAGPPRA